MQLYETRIIRGNTKLDNVLNDMNNNTWIISFGRGYTRGFVDREKGGTIEGDLQGLVEIARDVFSGRV
jgi:hypothetical protein